MQTIKKFIFVFTLVLFSITIKGQESFLKKYKIKKMNYCNELKIDTKIRYDSGKLNYKQKKSISDRFKIDSIINYTEKGIINNYEVSISRTVKIDSVFIKKQTLKLPMTLENINFNHAHVKLNDNNKLIVNPIQSDKEYFYKLKSGQEFRLSFSEWTVSALTIPIKYRFKQKGTEEDFSAGINLNMFIGRSYGRTNFMYRKGVDNKVNSWKISGGLIFGTSTIKLTKNNTNASSNPIEVDNESFNKGLFSIGLGGAYSFNAINFGIFYGWDYGIGESADRWNYNKKPWLGLGLGYSLFKF